MYGLNNTVDEKVRKFFISIQTNGFLTIYLQNNYNI